MTARTNVHASVVAFGPQRGAIILGPSGAGKSTLALALIEAGAQLVADDQAFLIADGGQLYARAPQAIEGLIEVRGLGLLRLPFLRLARIALALDLTLPAERLPQPKPLRLAGIDVPCLPARTEGAFPRAAARYLRGLGATG